VRFALICGLLLAFMPQDVRAAAFFSGDNGCDDTGCDTGCDAGCTNDTASCDEAVGCCDSDEGCTKCGGGCCCFVWGKHTFLKVGAGIRTSYNVIEDGHPNGNPRGGTKHDFNLNNARLYFNGKGHERIGFEFNTDINNAQNFDIHGYDGFGSMDEGEMRILDAVVKFQLTNNVNLWMGRFLPPSDRANLSGPFFQNNWNFPFVQFGYPNIFQGRDDGAALWGQYGGGAFKWQVGLFEGESAGGPEFIGQPGTDNLMFTGRVVLNLLDPEPGYYNSSTYYGEKDILALGASVMHRKEALAADDGAADYTGWNLDLLFERRLSNCGVVTFEAAYYDFDDNDGYYFYEDLEEDFDVVLPPTGGLRQGESFFLLGSYLFPGKCCLLNVQGQFQVMFRYQEYEHDDNGAVAAATDEQTDVQLNYIMFGHNARISAVWSQLDDGVSGKSDLNTFTVGTQLQF